MLWQKDRHLRAGGRWCCAEKRRQYNQTRHTQRVEWAAAKSDRDPVGRITHRLQIRRYHALKRIADRHPAEEGSTSSPATEARTKQTSAGIASAVASLANSTYRSLTGVKPPSTSS